MTTPHAVWRVHRTAVAIELGIVGLVVVILIGSAPAGLDGLGPLLLGVFLVVGLAVDIIITTALVAFVRRTSTAIAAHVIAPILVVAATALYLR